MKYRRNKKKLHFILLFYLFIFISLGYAYLNTNLNIKGNTKIQKNSWNIYFDNIVKTDNSNILADPPKITGDKMTINFSIELTQPGDNYEFTADIINAGSINAMISEVIQSGLNDQQAKYIDYKVTYFDGQSLKEKDALPAGEKETIKISVKYIEELDDSIYPEEDQSLKLSLTVNYVQEDATSIPRKEIITHILEKTAVLDNKASEFVTSDNGIDFSIGPSDTNGKGVYIKSGTENNANPIYYYRGEVKNNNIIFANFCWKIVRTTETGGTKLIYNGVPGSGGSCNNTKDASEIGKSAFNSSHTSPADVGYMYGTRYTIRQKNLASQTESYIYGNDVNWNGDSYTLVDTTTSTSWENDRENLAKRHHYTCFSTSNNCDKVYYINYFGNNSVAYYFELTGGDDIELVKNKMFANTNDSAIKTTIDSWYSANMTNYTKYLEDTVWCNDRTIYSGSLKGKDEDAKTNYSYFGSYKNNVITIKPNLTCPNKSDSFTVDSETGNKKLTYPVALLTVDELTLAGNGYNGHSARAYLNTGQYVWISSSPYSFAESVANVFDILASGDSKGGNAWNGAGVRPAISLKPNTKILNRAGTIDDPYIVLE